MAAKDTPPHRRRRRPAPMRCSPTSTPSSAPPRRTATARCSSSPAPAPARRRRSRTASPTSSRAAPTRGASCCSRSRAAPPPRCCAASKAAARLAENGGAAALGRTRLGRHLPRGRRAAAAHPRARPRHGAGLHDPGPRRLRGPHARVPHRARPRPRRRRASRRSRPASTSTRAASTRSCRSPRCCAAAFPWCRDRPTPTSRSSSRSTPTRRRSSRCSTTTTCCSSGTGCSPTRLPASACASASTTCWSTSTRTPTRCRPTSSRCCAPTAPASRASATTPRPSTASAPPRCATSSTSSSASPAPRSLTLTRNYRSTAPILAATNAIIAEAAERRDKELWTGARRRRPPRPRHLPRRGRADGLALRAHPRAPRAGHAAQAPVRAVPRAAPLHGARDGALAPRTSRSASTAACASSRWRTSRTSSASCASPRTRATPWPACACSAWCRASGPKTAAALMEALAAGGGDFAAWVGAAVPEPARATWPDVVSLFARSPAPAPATCRRRSTPCAASTRRCSSAATTTSRRACATSSRSSRSPSSATDRSQFLAELVLDPPAYTQDFAGPPVLDEDYLVLSTMHSAKGLEFDAVYVIHAADGNIPSATWRPARPRRSKRSGGSSTSPARGPGTTSTSRIPLRYYTQPYGRSRHPRLRAAHAVPDRGRHAALRRDARQPGAAEGRRHTAGASDDG